MEDIATWGINDSLTYGIIQSRDFTETHKTAEVRNEIGQVVRIEQFDKEYQATFTIVTTGELPALGDAITIEKTELYISSIEETENNQNYKKAKITCKGSKGVTAIEQAQ